MSWILTATNHCIWSRVTKKIINFACEKRPPEQNKQKIDIIQEVLDECSAIIEIGWYLKNQVELEWSNHLSVNVLLDDLIEKVIRLEATEVRKEIAHEYAHEDEFMSFIIL